VTSCPESRNMPGAADHYDAIAEALTEVSADAFFADARRLDADVIGSPGDADATPWLRACVSFTGSLTGSVGIRMQEPLAKELMASLVGMMLEQQAPDNEMFDGIGEYANMVCGRWLTSVCAGQRFSLHPPMVTRGETDCGSQAPEAADGFWMAVNDLPVYVALTLVRENP
jgi:CheY-specific phosphatase CheX